MCVCVIEREGMHVSGGKFYFEKNLSHFFLGQKLLHVPTCIKKFCHVIKLDNIGENASKMCGLPRELFGCFIKKRLETEQR